MLLIGTRDARLRRRWKGALHGIAAIHEVAEGAALEQALARRKPTILLLDVALLNPNRVGSVSKLQQPRNENRPSHSRSR